VFVQHSTGRLFNNRDEHFFPGLTPFLSCLILAKILTELDFVVRVFPSRWPFSNQGNCADFLPTSRRSAIQGGPLSLVSPPSMLSALLSHPDVTAFLSRFTRPSPRSELIAFLPQPPAGTILALRSFFPDLPMCLADHSRHRTLLSRFFSPKVVCLHLRAFSLQIKALT